MESQRKPDENEIERFAERILAEPEYRKMVLAVLCMSGKKTKPLIAGEVLLQKLIGPPLQAKTIVTLFRTLQGAEYSGFCRDLFETAKILTELEAVGEGMALFIGIGLICFGGADLRDKEREEVIAFLQAGRKIVNIPEAAQRALDDYLNQTLEPKIEIYRQLRKDIMEKIKNPDQWRQRLAANLAFMTAFIGLMILYAAAPQVSDEDSHVSPAPSPPTQPDKIHPMLSRSEAPFSYARSICGSSGERKMFSFAKDDKQVRVTCSMEDNEPSLEIAERGPEGITNCIDFDLDDIPDACGSTVSPPRENLDQWFKEMVQEAARRISH